MEEIAVLVLQKDQFPKSTNAFQQILIKQGLMGTYQSEDNILTLRNEEGLFEFVLIEEDFEGESVIEIAGEFEDTAATLIDLTEIFENAFPEAIFSTAYDEEEDFEEY